MILQIKLKFKSLNLIKTFQSKFCFLYKKLFLINFKKIYFNKIIFFKEKCPYFNIFCGNELNQIKKKFY